MYLGRIKLDNNVMLAPMSGVSDLPFRKIVKKFSPALVFSEMIASRALIRRNEKSLHMAKKNTGEVLAIQIAGCDPEIMSHAAKICESEGADLIDINMGCPVKKVINGYAGSALMKNLPLAISIIESVVNSVKIPVTLKMRTGWDDNSRNAPELAKLAEELGIVMITVHGRTRCQMFRGKSDWSFIKKVKENVKIPVIANGDILNSRDSEKILSKSSADGIMIGRGSYGNPWIFKETINSLNGKKFKKPSIQEIREIILEHLDLNLSHYDKNIGIKNFRKHLGWYSRSLKNSNAFRQNINVMIDNKEIKSCIVDFFQPKNFNS